MRFYYVIVLAFLVVAALPVMGANITLTYSECRVAGNDTICAPENLTLNKTAIYETCISDLKASFNSTSASVLNTCNSVIANQTMVFSNLTVSVQKLEGFNLSETYAKCVIELNVSNTAVSKWKNETQQRDDELKAALAGRVNESVLQQCQADKSVALSRAEATRDDARNFFIAGAVAGAGGFWAYRRRAPSDELDTRGGRVPRPGRI